MALAHRFAAESCAILHVHHGLRGAESDADLAFVRALGKSLGLSVVVRRAPVDPASSGIEEKARKGRHAAFRSVAESRKAVVLTGHTADDQVETLLMRIFEGAGLSGLKGIPITTPDGVERPLLNEWRDDLLAELRAGGIPFRTDSSNVDVRFERNWVRAVLVPLLVERYGPSVRRRLHELGERFREMDDYLDAEAVAWIGRSVIVSRKVASFDREPFRTLPVLLSRRVIQHLCRIHGGKDPGGKLLVSLDALVRDGRTGASLRVGSRRALKVDRTTARFVVVPDFRMVESPPAQKRRPTRRDAT